MSVLIQYFNVDFNFRIFVCLQEREDEKGKWQNFSHKAFGKKGFVKKSIFKVGIFKETSQLCTSIAIAIMNKKQNHPFSVISCEFNF